MRRRSVSKNQAPALPQPTPPPPREHYTPPWSHRKWSTVQHTSNRLAAWIRYALEGRYRIPRFQRCYVWTDEQILALWDSFLGGYHVGSLLLWERYDLAPSTERLGEVEVQCADPHGLLVVDGQQRLGALLTSACSGRFFFDLQAGKVVIGQEDPWMCPMAHLLEVRDGDEKWFRWPARHAADHGLPDERVIDCWGAAKDMIDRVQVSAVLMGLDWSVDRVVESFRRINTEGTRMSEAELREALERREMEQR